MKPLRYVYLTSPEGRYRVGFRLVDASNCRYRRETVETEIHWRAHLLAKLQAAWESIAYPYSDHVERLAVAAHQVLQEEGNAGWRRWLKEQKKVEARWRDPQNFAG